MYIQFENHKLLAYEKDNEIFVSISDLCQSMQINRHLLGEHICIHYNDYTKYKLKLIISDYNKNCYINSYLIILIISNYSPEKYKQYKEILDKTFNNNYNLE